MKSYRRGDQIVPVLIDITFDIAAGDYVALMGPSGSGKSTLLNLIAGIDKPDSGTLHVGGVDITDAGEAELAAWRSRNVGFIFQFYNLMPVLTAFENVELPLLLTDLTARERREHVTAALGMVGLSDRVEHYPSELSGGQQQRVAIARAIITDPTILVADQPTGDLDRASAVDILKMMDRLNRELGKTIIMVTHDPHAAEQARGVTASRERRVDAVTAYLKLVVKNAFRQKLRTALTMLGIVVAILAFGLLRTVVDAWYAGSEAASATRLVTRNAISLVFSLPLTYYSQIKQVAGVKSVSYANWFGGVYIREKNFFPQFAVQTSTYFDLYPEFVVPPEQMREFLRDRKGAIVGRKLADTYGFKVGDQVTLRGTIFPGNWDFVVRGIYDGATARTDTSQFFFNWEYLNETMKKTAPRRANNVGVYVVGLASPDVAAEVAAAVDATFKNSLAESLTETEQAFQLGFLSMVETIVLAIKVVSFSGDFHHHGRHGEHHGDDRPRAHGGIRDTQGAGFRTATPDALHLRGVAVHCVTGRSHWCRPQLSGR